MTIEAAFFGTLSRDGEAKTSKAGKPYLRLNIRTGDTEGTWVNVMCFDESAIAASAKFVKSTAVYVEGKLSLDKWTGRDGAERTGLSCMSWHTRLAAIGRNKPPAKNNEAPKSQAASTTKSAGGRADPFDDVIPFAPEWRG
jgi:single-strand DNA-binding protein